MVGIEERLFFRGTQDYLNENDLKHFKVEHLNDDIHVIYVHFDAMFIGILSFIKFPL